MSLFCMIYFEKNKGQIRLNEWEAENYKFRNIKLVHDQ